VRYSACCIVIHTTIKGFLTVRAIAYILTPLNILAKPMTKTMPGGFIPATTRLNSWAVYGKKVPQLKSNPGMSVTEGVKWSSRDPWQY
jgi:hypothetical protein